MNILYVFLKSIVLLRDISIVVSYLYTMFKSGYENLLKDNEKVTANLITLFYKRQNDNFIELKLKIVSTVMKSWMYYTMFDDYYMMFTDVHTHVENYAICMSEMLEEIAFNIKWWCNLKPQRLAFDGLDEEYYYEEIKYVPNDNIEDHWTPDIDMEHLCDNCGEYIDEEMDLDEMDNDDMYDEYERNTRKDYMPEDRDMIERGIYDLEMSMLDIHLNNN